jgi:hypothetical protein
MGFQNSDLFYPIMGFQNSDLFYPIIGFLILIYIISMAIITDTNIRQKIEEAKNSNENITNWDVSQVTDMEDLFKEWEEFNQPLIWNTENVRNMSGMFSNCRSFNKPLVFDNTSNVEDMSYMFLNCDSFNQPLNFNTITVKNMSYMFESCRDFNGLLGFDTINVENMSHMFHGCRNFNKQLNFNTENVINMSAMFSGCGRFNKRLDFNTANVTNMSFMFHGCRNFNERLNFNTANVIDMGHMFDDCRSFNKLLDFNTENVTNMSHMFNRCISFNQPLDFNTGNVTNMSSMFMDCKEFNEVLDWNIEKVTSMSYMFKGCTNFNKHNQLTWDTSHIHFSNTYEMFEGCPTDRSPRSPLLPAPSPRPPRPPRPPFQVRKFQDILKKIMVFDPIMWQDVTAENFIKYHEKYTPFILFFSHTFSGNAIGWPSNKLFVECKDDTPYDWQGNTYMNYVKEGGRTLLKLNINGVTPLVLVPDWWDNDQPQPSTPFFKLIPDGKINKFMDAKLAKGIDGLNFDALGADHCNQTSEQTVYRLEPMDLHELEILKMPEKLNIKTNRLTRSLPLKSKSRAKSRSRAKSIGGKKNKKSRKIAYK